MQSLYFGEISEKGKKIWGDSGSGCSVKEILVNPIELPVLANEALLRGALYFHDEFKVDWGSYAWKCTEKEIVNFIETCKSSLPWVYSQQKEKMSLITQQMKVHKNVDYGVLWVEEY